jgi:hypothetical protein
MLLGWGGNGRKHAQDSFGGDIKGGSQAPSSVQPVDDLLAVVVLTVCRNAVLVRQAVPVLSHNKVWACALTVLLYKISCTAIAGSMLAGILRCVSFRFPELIELAGEHVGGSHSAIHACMKLECRLKIVEDTFGDALGRIWTPELEKARQKVLL